MCAHLELRALGGDVGDAGIVLGRTRGQTTDPSSDARGVRSNTEAHLVTRAHVLADPAERARFVAAGASVAEGTNETVRGLRVSRSVGDAFLKRELPGLVATPYVSASPKPSVLYEQTSGWS